MPYQTAHQLLQEKWDKVAHILFDARIEFRGSKAGWLAIDKANPEFAVYLGQVQGEAGRTIEWMAKVPEEEVNRGKFGA